MPLRQVVIIFKILSERLELGNEVKCSISEKSFRFAILACYMLIN